MGSQNDQRRLSADGLDDDSPDAEEGAGASGSDASVTATLRRLISTGHYPPGTRLAEAPVADALGVSRTPVRLAFRTLEQEGLLQKTGKRGLVVREFSETDVLCAVEVRGVLEGLAARRVADLGAGAGVLSVLAECVRRGREVLAKGHLTPDDVDAWSRLNRDFHNAVVGAAGSAVIAEAIARNNHLPFASADSIIIDDGVLEREYEKLRIAQVHHELVLDALQQRESARAESLMREHAWVGVRYGRVLGLAPLQYSASASAMTEAATGATVQLLADARSR